MRICFIGDSFVNGTGDNACLGWPGRICANVRQQGRDVTIYNLGIRRDTSADIKRRWLREAKARLPAEYDGRLIFSFGLNDCAYDSHGSIRVSPADSFENARDILTEASTWLPTLFIGPPPTIDPELNRRVKGISDCLDRICEDLSIPFLPIWDHLFASAIWLKEAEAGDGIHPNSDGYELLTNLVNSWQPWRSWFDEDQTAPSCCSARPDVHLKK